MAKKIACIAVIMLLPVFASAQLKSQDEGIDVSKALRYGLNPIGLVSNTLLDPEKLHIQQSYSISFMNAGNQNISQAMYLNTMTYQISNPLSVALQWGFRVNKNFGGRQQTGFYPGLQLNDGLFISGAQLKYKPTENAELRLEFRQQPNYYYYGMPFYGR